MTPPPPVPADVADARASAVRRLLNAHLLLPNFAMDVELIEEAHNALSAHARYQASTRPSATRPLKPLAPSQPENENPKL